MSVRVDSSTNPVTTVEKSGQLSEVVEWAKDWAQGHGICMRLKNEKTSDTVQIAPFSLLPSSMPKPLFDQAYAVQPDMSLLYHKIAFDYEFVKKSLSHVLKHDEFTKKLLKIYTDIKDSLPADKTVLTIQRSDYMFHNKDGTGNALSLKQVEVNNIAASFAGLSTRLTKLHTYLLSRLNLNLNLPSNNAVGTIAGGLVAAWSHSKDHPNGCILFVIEELNRNVMDQRAIEDEILTLTKFRAKILWMTLKQCDEILVLDEKSGKLTVKNKSAECSISVIYYRVGYAPEHYPTDAEWRARLKMEKSRAISCPWIGAHLVGTKKVQQVLADTKILEKYMKDQEAVKRISATFVGLYSLDQDLPSTTDIIGRACANPQDFVLKPQLEGGGNNFYGQAVKTRLMEMTGSERESFILMDRIHPVIHQNFPIRPGDQITTTQRKPCRMVSEFGTFGYLLGTKDKILANVAGGHLLRTKGADTDEGGVMAGAAVLDSPYLVPAPNKTS